MRFRKNTHWILFLFFLIGKLSAQTPTTYLQSKIILEENALDSKGYKEILQNIRNLPLQEDSLDWIAPALFSEANRLADGAADADVLLPLWTFENVGLLYSNYYANHVKALEYSGRELKHFKDADLEEKGYGFLYTNGLTRRMFLLAELEQIENSLQVAQQVQERVKMESDSLQRSFQHRQLCVFYHRINDTERGISNCVSGLNDALASGVPYYLGSFYETLALLQENDGQISIDSIIRLRKKAIYHSSNFAPAFNRVNYRNLGFNYLNLARLDSAEYYIKKSLHLFKDYPWVEGERISLIWLAQVYIHQGKLERAQVLADSLQALIGGQDHDALAQNLLNLALIGAYNHDATLATKHLKRRDSIIAISFSEERQALKEEYAIKYETAQREAENKLLTTKTARLQILILLGALVAVSAVVILVLIIRQSKRKRKLADQESQVLELKAEKENSLRIKAEQELERKKAELRETVNQSITYQNRNVEMLGLMEELQTGAENYGGKKQVRQMQSRLKDYATEDVLQNLDKKAQRAYPKLHDYLKEHLTGKGNTELLYCILIVMDYSQDDIARTMQRTEKAIKSLRYRVRKRLNLNQDQDIKAHLLSHSK